MRKARPILVLASVLAALLVVQACSTLFTPHAPTGVIGVIDPEARTFTIIPIAEKAGGERFTVSWYHRTEFVRDGKHTTPESLTPGTLVTIYYRQPIMAGRTAKKVVWETLKPR